MESLCTVQVHEICRPPVILDVGWTFLRSDGWIKVKIVAKASAEQQQKINFRILRHDILSRYEVSLSSAYVLFLQERSLRTRRCSDSTRYR